MRAASRLLRGNGLTLQGCMGDSRHSNVVASRRKKKKKGKEKRKEQNGQVA
jgi:hypothetical protein